MGRMVYLSGVVTLDLDPEKCVGCGVCLQVCPHGVLRMDDGHVVIQDRDSCMECGACARNCPSGAVMVQAGVGCAAAVINAALGRNSSSCCCVMEQDNPGEGLPGTPDPSRRAGCC
ncbi:MAG: 4Fe-4S binding protein [Deltaproteobacteria bacterium]|nr:4Fe-4S binding protein [Deltaproteobacteria bacterium]MBW2353104.1 4Fe-4S binding protein [Deltaproteobacteria bacterium]